MIAIVSYSMQTYHFLGIREFFLLFLKIVKLINKKIK